MIPNFAHLLLRCLITAIVWAVTTSASAQVLVVVNELYPGYEEAAQEFRERLASVADGPLRIDTIYARGLARVDESTFGAYKLIVTIGLSAALVTVQREDKLPTPPLTLCLLVPRSDFEDLLPARKERRDQRLSAVFIDQPVARQLDLIRIALPQRNRVGAVLYRNLRPIVQSATRDLMKQELLAGARERELILHLVEVPVFPYPPNIFAALQSAMAQSDVLLALPDPAVINSGSLYDFLLTTYRARVPVVGFSEGLVTAGALLSLYSTPRQQGRQGAEIAARILAGESGLPAPQYPAYFTVRVNTSVAQSMGLPMRDEADLAAALATRSEAIGEESRTRSISEASARPRP